MSALPQELYRAAQVRELDRTAIEGLAIPGLTLMERAGTFAFNALRARWPKAKRIAVVTGTGNNGGDGYVLARLAREAGLEIAVLQLGDPERIAGDALGARQAYLAAKGTVETFSPEALRRMDVVVDAMLGTGLEREVREPYRGAIETLNVNDTPVLAIDIPSGLHGDTGTALGVAVRATCTATFIGLKQGQFTGQAADHCGDIDFTDLQVPPETYEHVTPAAQRLDLRQFDAQLAPRVRTSHKGHFGHGLIVGGDHGMSGAPRMAGEAAARMGAGLVSVATRPAHAAAIASACPVLMVHGVDSAQDLEPLLARATVVAVGPGLGQSDWARGLLGRVLEGERPLVLDADALNLLASEPLQRDKWVLTPHPGEAGRLLDRRVAEIQADRFAAANELASRYGGTCVLKGAGTLVATRGRIAVCAGGNPGMASGGMGDLLTGIVAGLLAQGLTQPQAGELGVCVHAAAADRAARQGERGLLASDLFAHLQALINP